MRAVAQTSQSPEGGGRQAGRAPPSPRSTHVPAGPPAVLVGLGHRSRAHHSQGCVSHDACAALWVPDGPVTQAVKSATQRDLERAPAISSGGLGAISRPGRVPLPVVLHLRDSRGRGDKPCREGPLKGCSSVQGRMSQGPEPLLSWATFHSRQELSTGGGGVGKGEPLGGQGQVCGSAPPPPKWGSRGGCSPRRTGLWVPGQGGQIPRPTASSCPAPGGGDVATRDHISQVTPRPGQGHRPG